VTSPKDLWPWDFRLSQTVRYAADIVVAHLTPRDAAFLEAEDSDPHVSLAIGAFHAVGQLNVFELDQWHFDTPFEGCDVEDLSDIGVDAVGLRQRLVKGVCWPTTLRSVVCEIWLMAAWTFSMAITDFTASTTRKLATAEMPTLTLSRVMMPPSNPVQRGLIEPRGPATVDTNSESNRAGTRSRSRK
jgi:hypothetical protein